MEKCIETEELDGDLKSFSASFFRVESKYL
jgi:hypothetical protein